MHAHTVFFGYIGAFCREKFGAHLRTVAPLRGYHGALLKTPPSLTEKAGAPICSAFPGRIETWTRPSQDWKLGMSTAQSTIASTSPKVTFNHCLCHSKNISSLRAQPAAFHCFLHPACNYS